MKKIKYLIVSSILPRGHCSEYLVKNLKKSKYFKIYLICEMGNYKLNYIKNYYKVFNKNFFSYFFIFLKIIKINPDIVNVQHEINMYGNKTTSIFFPLLLILLKLLRFKVITTVHGIIDTRHVDKKFLYYFNVSNFIPIFIIKFFFHFIFRSIILFSDLVIVHTNLSKMLYEKIYAGKPSKILKISLPINPKKSEFNTIDKNLFTYYGYFVRRKNLPNLILEFTKFSKFFKFKPTLYLIGTSIKGQEESLSEIVSYVRTLNKQNIKIVLNRSFKYADKIIKKSAVVLIPADISIGSSGPLMHYYNNSKFVIANKVGHLEEDIVNNVTGLHVSRSWSFSLKKFYKNRYKYIKLGNELSKSLSFRTYSYTRRLHEQAAKVLIPKINTHVK
jgi:hypothetical protein